MHPTEPLFTLVGGVASFAGDHETAYAARYMGAHIAVPPLALQFVLFPFFQRCYCARRRSDRDERLNLEVSMPTRYNVLLFAVDEMRASDLGCAGNPIVQTPNLDHLAREGVHFPRAYCNHTICEPARATMFTGWLPRDHGAWSNGMEMRPDAPVLPRLLAEAGYRTHSVGKLHLQRWFAPPGAEDDVARYSEDRRAWDQHRITHLPLPYYGFQSVDFVGGHGNYVTGEYFNWLEQQIPDARRLLSKEGALETPSGAPLCYKMGLPAELHYNRWIADHAISFLEEASRGEKPFFLWCSFPDPHEPYCPPAPYCYMYDPAQMPLPTRREGELDELPPYYKAIYERRMTAHGCVGGPVPDPHWQEIRALTYGSITFVDGEVGRVMARLEALGLRENTLVGFISDHGDMMGDHWMIFKGPYVFEGCARVPFILSLPGGARGGVHVRPVSQIDLVPTVLDVCGVESPGVHRLCVYNEGEKLEQVAPIDLWPGESLRPSLEGHTATERSAVVIHNDDPYLGLKIRTLVTERYKLTFYAGQEFGEFFDLENDPGELHNLWHQQEWQTTRDSLLLQLLHEDTCLAPWYPLPYRSW